MLMVNQDNREIFIYDQIGPSWAGMDSADDMVRALATLGPGPIDVRINSPGGDVFAGFAMYSNLKRHNGLVTTYNDGLAASAASVVLLAGQERVGSPLSDVMIHEASTIAFGNADDFLKVAELLDGINNQLADLYVQVSGSPKEDILSMMKDETWLAADSALAMRFYTKKADDDEKYQNIDRQNVPQGMYRHAPAALLKPPQLLKMVKNRPDAEKETRYKKLFDLTGVDLRIR